MLKTATGHLVPGVRVPNTKKLKWSLKSSVRSGSRTCVLDPGQSGETIVGVVSYTNLTY